MTVTHDIATLCAAIDGGDDSALLPLADALEDRGDALASGLRKAHFMGSSPQWAYFTGRYQWLRESSRTVACAATLCDAIWLRLTGYLPHSTPAPVIGQPGRYRNVFVAVYPSRSSAYLALAEALITGD